MRRARSWSDYWQFVRPRARPPQALHYRLVRAIRDRAAEFVQLDDRVLQDRADRLREAVRAGAEPTSPDVLVPAFALVHEAARRTIGISYFDVQLLGGLALCHRTIAQMQTGEGKTFVAALPAFVYGLTGRGVHVMTVNSYLAQRDFELLTPVYALLGTSAGLLPQVSHEEKRAAYACDITYGPGYEFGFDYLRDQVALLNRPRPALGETYRNLLRGRDSTRAASVQRGLAFAIIDEADSVLIDEATTALIISEGGSPAESSATAYVAARSAAELLTPGADYLLDRAAGEVRLTASGTQNIHSDPHKLARLALDRPWSKYVEQALWANLLLHKDVHYVAKDGKIAIVDQFTGRIFDERSWREGLHQAVEVKEGLSVTAERRPLAHISRQRFFALYEALCGMTGTATGSERELWHFYHLPVIAIPTHRTCRRRSLPLRFFSDLDSKWAAIAREIERLHATRQPVLVGTRTIAASGRLAEQLDSRRVEYELLNGVQDAEEAAIVARAGRPGAVTIATNMAGRGTDIKLAPGVVELGGLHVIATEPHESARIDRQLVGRSARQGDPGSCRLFVSADDELIACHASWLGHRMKQIAGPTGEFSADFSAELARLQRKLEQLQFVRRRQLFAHDDWLDDVLAKLAKESA